MKSCMQKLIVSKNYCIKDFEVEISFFCNFLHIDKNFENSIKKEFYKGIIGTTLFNHELTTPICDVKANNIKDELNAKLTDWLNVFHKKDYCEDDWAVVLYPFISLYVDHIYVMHKRIKFLLENYFLDEILVDRVEFDYGNLPKNVDEFIVLLADINFNNFLFLQLISGISEFKNSAKNIRITVLSEPELELERPSDTTQYVAKNLKSSMRNFAHKVFEFIPLRSTQPLIIGSFLPYFQDCIFKLINLSSPKIIKAPKYKNNFADMKTREGISFALKDGSLEDFIFNHVKFFLPLAHIEDYENISSSLNELKWPRFPRYIFTSNNYFWDESFKVWAAERRYEGVPIVIGQHGNHFGTNVKYRYCPEVRISSKFLTWGWKRESKHIPFAVLKTVGRGTLKTSNGGILFVISTNDNRTSPITFIMNTHFDRLISTSRAMNFLSDASRKAATIRLLHKNSTLNGNEAEFFKNNNPEINIEYGEIPFVSSIRNNRLIVFCYDSTGLLECISMNKPCVSLMLEVDLNILEPDALILYREMIQVGIFHMNPESLSTFINTNWSDINGWWNENNRQETIRKFSDMYAKNIKFPIYKLYKSLNDISKKGC